MPAFAALTSIALGLFSFEGAVLETVQPINIDRGKILFNRCRACHELKADGPRKFGPHLADLFDRQAGELEDFAYSASLTGAAFQWTPDKLNQWLTSPNSFLPGNRMNFAGVKSERDRQDLIAYLKMATVTEE